MRGCSCNAFLAAQARHSRKTAKPPSTPQACRARTELMRAKADGGLTVDELVAALKPRGRAVKAELLAALRAAIA